MTTTTSSTATARVLLWAALPFAFLVASEKDAQAQACCVAPGAAGTASRLAPHEDFLSGIDARAQTPLGTFDPNGRFRGARSEAREVGLEQSVFATGRALTRGQLTLAVPFVQTFRASNGTSASGGGIGDVRLSTRWDVIASSSSAWAGLAIVGGATIPTGRPPERASDPLGAGATGIGTTQGWIGLSSEKTWGPWLASVTSIVAVRADRHVEDVTFSLPPRFSNGVLGAYAWTSGIAVSLSAVYAIEGRASVDDRTVSGSARRSLTMTTALQVPIFHDFGRLVGSAFITPPIPVITAGESAPLGVSISFIKPLS